MRRRSLGKWIAGGVAAGAVAGGIVIGSGGNSTHHTTLPKLTIHCRERTGLPDWACSPGVPNANVTQANIKRTICVRGWTATIRPPASYTDRLKRAQIQDYGNYAEDNLHAYEEDHLVPLEVGGDPTNPDNLWPEAAYMPDSNVGFHQKDKLENYVHRAVCDGRMTLAQGRAIFLGDYVAFYHRTFGVDANP